MKVSLKSGIFILTLRPQNTFFFQMPLGFTLVPLYLVQMFSWYELPTLQSAMLISVTYYHFYCYYWSKCTYFYGPMYIVITF